MINYKIDCVHYTPSNNSRSRPFCYKLTQEIRPKDCVGCGWYRRYQQPNEMVEVDVELNKLLRSRSREELGLGAIMSEDIERLRRKE